MISPAQAFGGNKSPLSRTDLRIIAIVLALCLAVFLAWVSDQAVFPEHAKPTSHFQAILAYVAIFGYWLTESRLTTFFLSITIYFTLLAIIGVLAFWYLEIYVIEPLIMKKRLMYVKREKALMNKYGDEIL